MPRGTEEVLQERMWSWLTEQGYVVAGEVPIEDGFIDLVARNGDEYLGFELKTVYAVTSQAGFSLRAAASTLNQIRKYTESSNFDRFYLCCESPQKFKKRLKDAENSAGHNSGPSNSIINQLGLISISLLPGEEIEIVKEANQLTRTETPELSKKNEAWVNHQVWKWAKETKQTVTREGLLPGEYYIDLSVFEGSNDTTEILGNQSQYSHIGIESKGVEGLSSFGNLSKQLNNYIESGGLTHLYLAVPEQGREQVDPQVGQQTLIGTETTGLPQNIGIITVSVSGDIQIIQEPEKLNMEYDGIRWSDTESVPVGWGARYKQRHDEFDNTSNWYYQNHTLY